MMKVLLPVDGMDDAKLIMDFVSKYQWPQEAEFRVLHVVGSSETDEEAAKADQAARAFVTEISEQVKLFLPEAEVSWEVQGGFPVYEIVEEALHWKANMIVMGYRTRPVEKPYLAGSVSTGVSTQASCSVAIIRPEISQSATTTERATEAVTSCLA